MTNGLDQILRPAEAAKRLGIGRSTLYEWARRDGFPRPLKLGARATGWRWSELEAWLEQRAEEGAGNATR